MNSQQGPNQILQNKFRRECLYRGPAGIKGLAISLRDLDKEDTKTFTNQQLKLALDENGINMTNGEVEELFKQFDHEKNGNIDFDEFFYYLRAFSKLDRFNNGKITVDDLKNSYKVDKNPKFLNGELTGDEVLRQFLMQFDIDQHKDGTITLEEFVNYYAGISAYVDSDAYFDVMVRQEWKL